MGHSVAILGSTRKSSIGKKVLSFFIQGATAQQPQHPAASFIPSLPTSSSISWFLQMSQVIYWCNEIYISTFLSYLLSYHMMIQSKYIRTNTHMAYFGIQDIAQVPIIIDCNVCIKVFKIPSSSMSSDIQYPIEFCATQLCYTLQIHMFRKLGTGKVR